jgi:hypothetical protein
MAIEVSTLMLQALRHAGYNRRQWCLRLSTYLVDTIYFFIYINNLKNIVLSKNVDALSTIIPRKPSDTCAAN